MLKSLPHNKIHIFAIPIVGALLVASCGSYQQASYYDDGIYSSGNEVVRVEKKNADAVRMEEQESNIYGEYFGQKASEYEEILDSEIFTDIDGYSSQMANDTVPYGEQTDYFAYNNTYNGNPGWGDNPSNLTINVYDNSWGWGGLGWGWGWNDPFWGYGWNSPYYGWGWGWNRPWRYNNWGWAGYYGWGNPWGGWGWAGYYGWGGYYGHWNRPYYYNNYRRNYAYMTGRRGYNNDYIPGTTLRGRSNLASRTSDTRAYSGRSNADRTSRSYNGTTARRTVSADAIARNRDYRTSRSIRSNPSYSGSSRSYRSYGTSPSTRSNGSYSRSNSATRSSSPSYRSSSSSRSYQSTPRSSTYSRSSGASRSSGSYRSSGSSSRSSGSYRSSGGSSSRSSGGASRSSGSSRSGRGGRP